MNRKRKLRESSSNFVKRRKKTKTNASDPKEKLKKARLYLELSVDSAEAIRHANESLSRKIDRIFATASALVPIVAGLGYFILKGGYSNGVFVLMMLSFVFLFIAIGVGLFLHGPGDFRYLDASVIFKKHKGRSLKFLINKSASTLSDINIHNSSVLNSKETGIKLMLVFIFIGLVFVAIAFADLGMNLIN